MFISSSEFCQSPEATTSRLLPETFDYAGRRSSLLARLSTLIGEPRAALICDPHDICYLTGVREGISWLALWDDGGFAVTRHMLIREVTEVVDGLEILLPSDRSTDPVVLEAFVVAELARRGAGPVAVNPDRMSASSYKVFERNASEHRLVFTEVACMVDTLRQCKDEAENRIIRRCIHIAEKAFAGLLEEGASGLVGRSELELARELESRMIGLGADRQGFPETGIIVASGPNSASAHHCPGRRLVQAGEPLLIDWGAEIDGYRSDMTRTLFPGGLPEFARKAYPVVNQALESAARLIQVGADMGEVDRAAREAVASAGYPEFHYGVGHGFGLAIHEAPWLRAHSKERLELGMITTVEPGIYLPGTGGIRIESIFEVTRDGSERLDQLSTSLEEMVLE